MSGVSGISDDVLGVVTQLRTHMDDLPPEAQVEVMRALSTADPRAAVRGSANVTPADDLFGRVTRHSYPTTKTTDGAGEPVVAGRLGELLLKGGYQRQAFPFLPFQTTKKVEIGPLAVEAHGSAFIAPSWEEAVNIARTQSAATMGAENLPSSPFLLIRKGDAGAGGFAIELPIAQQGGEKVFLQSRYSVPAGQVLEGTYTRSPGVLGMANAHIEFDWRETPNARTVPLQGWE